MGSQSHLHAVTPLYESLPFTKIVGFPVYLKCENLQPSGSFKLRGIGHFLTKKYAEGVRDVVIASGGNAGLATAFAARQLGMNATVVIPETARLLLTAFHNLGAKTKVHGNVYDESNEEALRISKTEGFTYIHPYDHPLVWEGNETVLHEIKEQLKGQKPRGVVVSVGGGGLLVGLLQGLHKCGWNDVPVFAMETRGAHGYNLAVEAKKLIPLEELTSIAQCLSTRSVSQRAFDYANNNEHPITSLVVDDRDALEACYRFLDDHRFLVEPACGASLAAIYTGLIDRWRHQLLETGPLVVIVCGGAGVTLDALNKWKKQLETK